MRSPVVSPGRQLVFVATAFLVLASMPAWAGDWSRFRGPNGTGISQSTGLPVQWSATRNVKWKTDLPGRGLSSPIVVGDRVVVTCYSGYAMQRDAPGEIDDLKRHVVCADSRTGEVLWSKTIPAVQPEDPYKGFLTEHGYASNTPVSDGQRIYVFLGKSGVYAFELDGTIAWHTSVGTGSGPNKWGSAASPILCDDLIIVNASDESQSLVALDKKTGAVVWTERSARLGQNWSTPVLLDGPDGKTLAMVVLEEIWGIDPATGNVKWRVPGFKSRGYSASFAAADGVVYHPGGMLGGSSFALPAEVPGDAPRSFAWTSNNYESIISPLVYDGYVYGTTNRGVVYCLDAETGKRVYQVRLASGAAAKAGGKPGRSGRSGPGGGEYASPILADGRIYIVTRPGITYVLAAGPQFQLLARNTFGADSSGFCATPAVGDHALFIRSNQSLYCVAKE